MYKSQENWGPSRYIVSKKKKEKFRNSWWFRKNFDLKNCAGIPSVYS